VSQDLLKGVCEEKEVEIKEKIDSKKGGEAGWKRDPKWEVSSFPAWAQS